MKTYIALLRGINVGGNNKVSMSELKKLFEDNGFENVYTYINSGNVIFRGFENKLSDLEPAFKKQFGFSIKFLFIEKSTFKKIHNAIPQNWTNDSDYKTDVWFLWKEYAKKSSMNLLTIRDGVDEVIYTNKSIVWHVPKKHLGKSGMNKITVTDLYKNLTARNINTVRKLCNLL